MGWTSGPPVLEAQERTRANLDAGARPRFRTRTKVAVVLSLILLVVGGCTSFAWIFFGQYVALDQRIVAQSNGAISTVIIAGAGGQALIQVYMARGITDVQAREIVCRVVMPELSSAGIQPFQVQVFSSTVRLISSRPDLCAAPLPTAPPSPVPNSGTQLSS